MRRKLASCCRSRKAWCAQVLVDAPRCEIVARALSDLRRDLDRDDWAFGLLPETFSLRELQLLHEAIRGEPLNKPAFRKRLIESGRLEATGQMETGKGFRPAELYRARKA
jgi:8-oxo-dGTP diphosphatase